MKGTRAIISNKLPIQNTLFVSKNGVDATALRNRWDQPYLTIFAAQAAAVAGDTIYIFPGDYNEGSNDVIKSDVEYFFEPGSKLICLLEAVSDYGIAKNIRVDGYGDFECTNLDFGTGTIRMANAASTIFLRCRQIIGRAQAISISDGDTFDIKFDYATVTSQYTVDIRGNISGTLEFDTIDSASGASALQFRTLGTDLVSREIFVKGKQIKSVTNSIGAVSISNTNNTRMFISDFEIQQTGSSALIEIWGTNSGINYFRNVSGFATVGEGVDMFSGDSTNKFENCNFVAKTLAFICRGNARAEIVNSTVVGNEQAAVAEGAVIVVDTAQLSADNCEFVQEATSGTPCVLNCVNNNVRLKNCKLVCDPSLTESIRNTAAVPVNIMLELNCVSNKPAQAIITNIIAGTTLIVDANVARNSSNFFEN